MIFPTLTLVGAGPGDPELLTIKGMKAIQSASAILYDDLANVELLKYASDTAVLLNVGKKGWSKTSCSQEAIHALIVEYAFRYGNVVRLKGGDPFVFGRGHEEIAYAERFGITTNVIPGISSALAVPELQKIPLTSRGVAESFWVLTGTTRFYEISDDIMRAAQTNTTIVILMGMKNLTQITETFRVLGRENTPIAVIQNGSTPDEKYAVGTINDILAKVEEKQLGSPAIIIIGEVVRLSPIFEEEQEAMISKIQYQYQ